MVRTLKWLLLLCAIPFAVSCGDSPDDIVDDGFFYTFTSGPVREGGDGFDWPDSPPGLIDDFPSTSFTTPDGFQIFHDIGNNLFFDDNYLIPDDAVVGNGIVDEAIWGNPRPTSNDIVEAVLMRFTNPVQSVAFDFSWVLGPAEVFLAVGDEPGGDFALFALGNTFNAGAPFQSGSGFSARIEFSVDSLRQDFAIDIPNIFAVAVFVDEISDGGGATAFAIDNLSANGAPAP